MRARAGRDVIPRILLLGALALTIGCGRLGKPKPPSPAPGAGGWGVVPADRNARETPGSDRDRDKVTDNRERELKSNPDDPDTDHDGFTDGFEDRLADFGFDLVTPTVDRDKDGLPDAREQELHTNPASPDSDRDGWGDFDEELNRYFGFDPTKPTADTDFDGLSDDLERRIGSSPRKIDTNEDNISDFQAYAADVPPGGEPLRGPLADIMGITYSPAMAKALVTIRRGGRFSVELARQLPYPDVTAPLVARRAVRPSAALMQRAVYNPSASPPLYPPYAEIEQELYAIATAHPSLVRLFYWTGHTVDSCDPRSHREAGRTIYAVKISDRPDRNENEPEVLFMGTHHGRELITALFTTRFLRTLADGYATDAAIRDLVDRNEIWFIPVVNPNGYERANGSQIDWRKNTRLADPAQRQCGVDINRNYGFEHVTMFPPAQRASLPDVGFNGVNAVTGSLVLDSPSFPGPAPFSEVETQAVRGLAHSHFLTHLREEVSGLACSLSWHTYLGVVGHPMSHMPVPPSTGLAAADVAPADGLTAAMASAAAYENANDDFPTLTMAHGCFFTGYATYGDSNDWLYKDKHTFSVLIEAYSAPERGGCHMSSATSTAHDFYPLDPATRDAVIAHNIDAATAMLRTCPR